MNRREFLLSSAMAGLQSARSPASELLQNGANPTEQAILQTLAHDPLRPQYHLLPQAGFVGDRVRRVSLAASITSSFTAASEAEAGSTP